MRKIYLSLSFLLFSFITFGQNQSCEQKVGLVLSGGGAKGLAHIGALKALEEHNIPVDFIVGTSMGGVVGGFYAAGYSPKEIESIATSKDFLTWVNGKIPEKFQFEYLKTDPTPKWLEVSLGVDSTFNTEFSPQLANDLSLNYELAELMAPVNEGPESDFDKLFIPFKAMGSEVFTQKQILLDHGNLGASLRATMAVPFVYRPVKVDGMYIFDGGIYNNFAVEPMKEYYQPDVMIGVNVASKVYDEYPKEKAEEMISSSLLFMILDKADPKKLGNNGIYIAPNMQGTSGFDFKNAQAIIDSGYEATMRQMSEIKKTVCARIDTTTLQQKRNKFNEGRHSLFFEEVNLEGYNSRQRQFIKRSILTEKGTLNKDQIKLNYYKLAAEPYFSDIFPKMVYNTKSEKYQLNLSSDRKQKIVLQIGGNIASSNLSNIFMGARFDYLNNYLFNNYLTGQIGSFHKSFSYQLRMNLAFKQPLYLAPLYDYSRYDYRNINKFILEGNRQYVVMDRQYYGVEIGMPLKRQNKFTIQLLGFNQKDKTSLQPNYLQEDTLYSYVYSGAAAKVNLGYNTLNKKLFPTEGKKMQASISYRYGNKSVSSEEEIAIPDRIQHGLLAKFYYEMYFDSPLGAVGFNIESALSSMNAFDQLQTSLLNSPAYYPTFESRTKWLPDFRAPVYIALGLKHQIPIFKKLALRTEVHGFKPITNWEISDTAENKNGWGNLTPDYAVSAMAAISYETPIGPISFSSHYYDAQKQWDFLLNLGFLMFKESPLN